MLTVWCVLNGTKYTDEDVHILRGMVDCNLAQPHRFICLSDRPVAGVTCLIPTEKWPGWWMKLALFRYAEGQNLYLDLDSVVIGNLDGLVSEQISLPANWAQSGWGGCQSSVMSWGTVDYRYGGLADTFNVDELESPTSEDCGRYHGLHGDQDYITAQLGNPGDGAVVPMKGIYSYRYHCQNGPPGDAKVICFHGNPKPGQVGDDWVIAARSMSTRR